jgi:hypothetical protein
LVKPVLNFFLNQKINIKVLDSKIDRNFIGVATLYGLYFDLRIKREYKKMDFYLKK